MVFGVFYNKAGIIGRESPSSSWSILLETNHNLCIHVVTDGTSVDWRNGATPSQSGADYVFERSGSTWYLYKNAAQVASGSATGTVTGSKTMTCI